MTIHTQTSSAFSHDFSYDTDAYAPEVSAKGLSPEESENVRIVLRRLHRERYGSSTTKLAKAIGVAQPTLSLVFAGKQNVGMKMLAGVAKITGLTYQQLMSGEVDNDESMPPFGTTPGWADVEKAVRREHPELPSWAYKKARGISGIVPPDPLSHDFVYEAALFVFRHSTEDERRRHEHEALALAGKRLQVVPTKLPKELPLSKKPHKQASHEDHARAPRDSLGIPFVPRDA